MAEPKDGGLAFPSSRMEPTSLGARYSANKVEYPGMSLRDYFAAQAMVALLRIDAADTGTIVWAAVADDAYSMADAMLAERAK